VIDFLDKSIEDDFVKSENTFPILLIIFWE